MDIHVYPSLLLYADHAMSLGFVVNLIGEPDVPEPKQWPTQVSTFFHSPMCPPSNAYTVHCASSKERERG